MRISVDGNRIRNHKVAFSNLSGIVWTGPNTHKKIHENGTFLKRSPEWNNLKTILFCISVDGELFVSATFRIH